MTEALARRLLPLRIIVLAMVAGIIAFAVVVTFLLRSGGYDVAQSRDLAAPLLVVLGVLGLSLLAAYPLIRRAIVSQMQGAWRDSSPPHLDDPILLRHFQTLTIVRASLAEGFALFAVVIYLLTAHALATVGGLVGVTFLFAALPTPERLERLASELGQAV